MYFCLEGKIGIGYTMFGRGVESKQLKLAKFYQKEFLVCDYYVIVNRRSEFVYKVLKTIKCFALSKKFLHREIFPKYPELAS